MINAEQVGTDMLQRLSDVMVLIANMLDATRGRTLTPEERSSLAVLHQTMQATGATCCAAWLAAIHHEIKQLSGNGHGMAS